jgi:predicted permease
VRTLRRAPRYAAIAIVALALGIGANAAIFSAVDTNLLRPLPYAHGDRLMVPVTVNLARGTNRGGITYADYEDWRREKSTFAEVALWRPVTVDLTGDGDPERVTAAQVSEDYFALVDTRPLVGRVFVPPDHAGKAPRVAVLTHGLWQRRFAGGAAVGRTIKIAGVPHEIAGVMPPHSVWPDDVQLFLPLRPELLAADVKTRRDNQIFRAIARLRDDVSIEHGNAVLAGIAARVEQENPESRKSLTNKLVPLREYAVETDVRTGLLILLMAVGAVLLITCANLANLALVRGTGRARELGVRLTLGASRVQLIRQLSAEGLLLTAAGGTLGAVLAVWLIRGLAVMAPEGTPFIDQLGVDARVLAATVALSAVATILAGVVPALANSSVQLGSALRDGTPGAGSSRRMTLLRHALIVGEITAAVVLLTGAALLVRSFERVTRISPGVDVDRVLAGRLSLPGSRYGTGAEAADFYERLTARLAVAPGVEAAAATSYVPLGGGGFQLGRSFLAEGRPEPPVGPSTGGEWCVITPDYFRVAGVPLLRGRTFDARDRADSTPVIIVSQTFARRMFGEDNPLGKRTRSWRDENVLREIVGVVADVRYFGLRDGDGSLVYVPHTQSSWSLMNVVVRAATTSPEVLAPMLRREIAALDSELAVANVQTFADAWRGSIAGERYTTLLLSLLAATALTLGALGIYGVMSYAVTLRRHELGVRVALGASRRHLYALVFKQGLGLTIIGLAIGLAGAYAASRLLADLLYETQPRDPLAFGATIAAVALAACLACLLPARRAAKADAIGALRST